LWPSKGTHNDESETTDVSAESPQPFHADDFRKWWEQRPTPTAARGRWKLTAKGRALVGIVGIVCSVLALKACAPSSDFFAYNDPAPTQSSGDKTVQSNDIDSLPGKDGAQAATEPLDDLNTLAPLAPLPTAGPKDVLRIQTTAGVSSATLVDTQAVASLSSQLSSAESPDPRSASTISSAPRAAIGARPSSSKLTVPTKRPGKITNRVVVATTEATVPGAAPDIPSESLAAARPAKAEEAHAPRTAQAADEPITVQSESPEAAKPPFDPLLQAIRDLFGARASPAQASIDPTPTGSIGWAVQLAASRSEDEAKNKLNQLNARYASALNGSTIRLHKARLDGETTYRLRVVGLSKADAEALCSRLKGDGRSCFVVR
jgi:hypothetical protein